ncbi:hypothetical protein [Pyrococcus yayanosii]|uniref:Uncharacterized protein n=1 Tax=Pyrococcus yayanosii (strain CH1 / JCM 16557) TaxID=529709 RepID=F8AIR7_PYRYC|nr:hypothetical protein [Pyrococcus yayanosii]AEH24099.1 hypothetical protein PYCH_04090 [Pyrococcus yayanosii CH1]
MMKVVGVLGILAILGYVYLVLRFENRDERFRTINAKSHIWAVMLLLFVNLLVQTLNYLNKTDKMFVLGFTAAVIVVSIGYILGFVYYSKVM